MCSPGENSSVADMFPTSSMTPVRLPPRSPRVHSALPRQLIPRAMTEVAPKRIERRTLWCIMEGVGRLVLGRLYVGERR